MYQLQARSHDSARKIKELEEQNAKLRHQLAQQAYAAHSATQHEALKQLGSTVDNNIVIQIERLATLLRARQADPEKVLTDKIHKSLNVIRSGLSSDNSANVLALLFAYLLPADWLLLLKHDQESEENSQQIISSTQENFATIIDKIQPIYTSSDADKIQHMLAILLQHFNAKIDLIVNEDKLDLFMLAYIEDESLPPEYLQHPLIGDTCTYFLEQCAQHTRVIANNMEFLVSLVLRDTHNLPKNLDLHATNNAFTPMRKQLSDFENTIQREALLNCLKDSTREAIANSKATQDLLISLLATINWQLYKIDSEAEVTQRNHCGTVFNYLNTDEATQEPALAAFKQSAELSQYTHSGDQGYLLFLALKNTKNVNTKMQIIINWLEQHHKKANNGSVQLFAYAYGTCLKKECLPMFFAQCLERPILRNIMISSLENKMSTQQLPCLQGFLELAKELNNNSLRLKVDTDTTKGYCLYLLSNLNGRGKKSKQLENLLSTELTLDTLTAHLDSLFVHASNDKKPHDDHGKRAAACLYVAVLLAKENGMEYPCIDHIGTYEHIKISDGMAGDSIKTDESKADTSEQLEVIRTTRFGNLGVNMYGPERETEVRSNSYDLLIQGGGL